MKSFKRSLLLLLCVVMLVVGALVMASCSTECTHEWGDWTVTTEATCMANGTETRTCSACGEAETRSIDKVGHTFSTYVADGNATCMADGTKTATCTTDGCTAKDTVADTGSKKAHSFTNYTSNGDATCQADGTKTAACDTEGCTATETVTDTGSKKEHSFTNYTSNGDATCQADGTKTATCDYYGCIEKDTVTDVGSKKEHSFTKYTSNSDATCVLDGTKTAICDFGGCEERDTIEDEGSKLGHLWNAELTCTTGHECTRDNCDAEEAALGHNYTVVGGTELTCEQDSTTVYACHNGCGDTFTVTNEVAKGHQVDEWTFDSERFVGNCTYELTYVGTCQNPKCGETVYKTETVERHTLKSAIHTDATCSVPGKKIITCTECSNYSQIENYTNPEAHTWVEKGVEGNVTTYECSGCHITKTAITAKEETETTVNKDTLESVGEVELKDANIKLDDATLGALAGDVSISAGTLNEEERNEIADKIGNKLDQIGNNPIYNFGLTDSNGVVSSFNGWVTIRVPYTLEDGEDVDSIAVWFINDKGEVESIEATYDNGYAVFSTNHFSYYTVTRLTPKERCNLYGHSYKETVVNATCVSDGYVIKVCQRCGDSVKEITGKATGHAITTTTVGATCTESGTATHSCSNCDYERVEKIAPAGHTWGVTNSEEATCKKAGYTVYTCSTCQESYKTVIAQKAHSYTDTVTKATCTTEGYTTRVCEWCGYTVTTNKIAALGHDYKTSTVQNGCTTEGYTLHDCSRCDASYKTDIVPPSHTWDIAEPTCGKGQTCIVCGKGGQSATGEHTMENGICTVCGTGCKHTFNSVVTAPTCTEVGFTTNTCTACGVVEKTDYKAATGHTGALNCTVCGASIVPEDFYTNILESFLNEKYTILVDELQINDNIYVVNSELFVSIKGGISGYGTVNVKAYGKIANFRAIIEDGIVYLCGENTSALTNSKDVYLKAPLATFMSTDMSSGVSMLISTATSEPALDWLLDTFVPFAMNLVADGKDEANLVAKTVIDLICNIEEVEGNIVITPSIDKIKALNTRLATETIGEFVDNEFGVGTYDAVTDKIDGLFDLTVGEILDGAASKNADVIELINSIDAILPTVIGMDCTLSELMELEVSIQDMLKTDELRAMTVEEIVNMIVEGMGNEGSGNNQPLYPEDEVYPDLNGDGKPDYDYGYVEGDKVVVVKKGDLVIDGTDGTDGTDGKTENENVAPSVRMQLRDMLIQMKSITLYQALGADTNTEETIKIVNDSIDTVFGDLSISIKTDKEGTLLSVDAAYGEYFDISIVANYTSTIDYSQIKAIVDEKTVAKTNENNLEGTYTDGKENGEYRLTIDENGNIIGVWHKYTYDNTHLFSSQTDDNGNYVEIKLVQRDTYIYEMQSGVIQSMIATFTDCGDWIGVAMMAPGTCSQSQTAFIEKYVNGELVEVIDDPSILEMLGIYSKNWVDSYDTIHSIEFFLNTKTGEITSFGDSDTLHDYEEDEAKHKPATGCEGVGEYHYFCTKCGETFVVTYTNGHDYEWTYELKPGATSCEDGIIATYACTVCGKVRNTYETDYHETEWEELDFTGYGVCEHHYFEKYSCPCGQESGFSCGNGLDWSEDGFFCPTCGVTVKEDSTYTPGEGCMMNVVSVILVTKDGQTLYSETINRTYESHDTRRIITLMPGATSCEEGVIITECCSKCGKVMNSYEEYGHFSYEQIVVDFSEYGSVCGAYLYTYRCACGEFNKNDYLEVSGKCEFEMREEYWRDWCDYLYKYTCAVTSPACGFTYYERAFFIESDCGRTCYKEYYVIDGNGEKIVVYTTVTESETYHSFETVSEDKTLVEGHPCLYYVTRVTKCTRCGYEETYVGYTFIHEITSHDDGWYCDKCDHGYHLEHDGDGCVIREFNVEWNAYNSSITKYSTETRWMYYKGYQFETFNSNQHENYTVNNNKLEMTDSNWSRVTRDYDFSGICWVTVTREDSYDGKDIYTDSYCACQHFRYNDSKASCTQIGVGSKICEICGNTTEYETSPILHEWIWYDYGQCFVCVHCGLKNANGASGDIVLEDASDIDEDEDTYIVGYYYRMGDKFEVIYAITLILESGEEIFVDLDEHGIAIAPWHTGKYVTFSKSAVINAAKKMGYTEDQFDIRISFVPVGWENDLDYAITFEVMSATDECTEHFYSHYDGCCVWCGQPEKEIGGCEHNDVWTDYADPTCTKHGYRRTYCNNCGVMLDSYEIAPYGHSFSDGWCERCGASEGAPEDCKHEYVDGWCIYCKNPDPNYNGGENGETTLYSHTRTEQMTDEKGEVLYTIYYDLYLYESGESRLFARMVEYGEQTETAEFWGVWHTIQNEKVGTVFAVYISTNYETITEYYVLNEYGELESYNYVECNHSFDGDGFCILCDYKVNVENESVLYVFEEYFEISDVNGDILYTQTSIYSFYSNGIVSYHVSMFDAMTGDPEMSEYTEWGEWRQEYTVNGKPVYMMSTMSGQYISFFTLNEKGELCYEGCEDVLCLHYRQILDYTQPTCTTGGFYKETCKDCGILIDEGFMEATGHYFENGECIYCGEIEEVGGEDDKKEILYTYKEKVTIYFYTDYSTYYTGRVYTADGMVFKVEGYSEWYMLAETGMIYTDVDGIEYVFILVDGNLALYVEGGEDGCNHEYVYTESVEPSCTDFGHNRTYCESCGLLLSDVITGEPAGHYFDRGECIYCGEREATGEECNHEFVDGWCIYCKQPEESWGEECNHEFVDGWCIYCKQPEESWGEECKHEFFYEDRCEATCTDMGYIRTICESCGTIINEMALAPFGHNFSEDGYCTNCGWREEKECNHEFVDGWCIYCKAIDENYATTCNHEDYDMDGWCDKCLEYVGIEESCKHEETYTENFASTCTDYGYIRTYCKMCGTCLGDTITTAPTGHTFENGRCVRCGESDGTGEEKVIQYTYKEKVTIYFYTDYTTYYTGRVYTADGMVYEVENYGEWYMLAETGMIYTWVEDVEYAFVLVDGNLELYVEGGEETECKHESTNPEYAEPTCTDSGFVMVFCTECGALVSEEYLAPYGHAFENGECVRCGEREATGEECNHEFVDGWCIYCKQPEESWGSGDDVIVEACKHEYDSNGYCVYCGQSVDYVGGNDYVIVSPVNP